MNIYGLRFPSLQDQANHFQAKNRVLTHSSAKASSSDTFQLRFAGPRSDKRAENINDSAFNFLAFANMYLEEAQRMWEQRDIYQTPTLTGIFSMSSQAVEAMYKAAIRDRLEDENGQVSEKVRRSLMTHNLLLLNDYLEKIDSNWQPDEELKAKLAHFKSDSIDGRYYLVSNTREATLALDYAEDIIESLDSYISTKLVAAVEEELKRVKATEKLVV